MPRTPVGSSLQENGAICQSTVISMLVEGRASLTETDSYYGNSILLWAADGCHTELLKWLLLNGASINATNNRGQTALLCAAGTHSRYGPRGVLATVQFLIGHGGSSIPEVDTDGNTALLLAAGVMHSVPTMKWLLSAEGGASIYERYNCGESAILRSAASGNIAAMQFLLEHAGANISDEISSGRTSGTTVWDLMHDIKYRRSDQFDKLTNLLRVIVLRYDPPTSLVAILRPEQLQIVHDRARLRARLPAYLARRRSLLNEHCPLLPPLLALVVDYEEPTTTKEIWATQLGEDARAVRIRQQSKWGDLPKRQTSEVHSTSIALIYIDESPWNIELTIYRGFAHADWNVMLTAMAVLTMYTHYISSSSRVHVADTEKIQ
jgi:hypothetical protein